MDFFNNDSDMRFIPTYVERKDIIRAFIFEGEHQKQDFKRFISSKEKIAKTLVAFANTEGGRLLIGVDDDGEMHTVSVEEEMYLAHEAATNYCQPPIEIQFSIHVDGENEILEINIPKGVNPPYQAKNDKGEWKSYFRDRDKVVLLKP